MALDKGIKSGKEHRKPYRGSKAFDKTCRNHGSCPWCKENRQHKFRDKQADELKEWRDDDGSSTVVYIGRACLDCLGAVANGGMTMDEYKYNVAIKGTKNGICHDEIIAFDMELDDAVILVKAYFDTYYAEPEMSLSIERVQREE